MKDDNSEKLKQIALIEDALDGSWSLDVYSNGEKQQILTFIKPENSGDWGALQQKTSPIDIGFISLEYRIIVLSSDIATMEVRVNEDSKVLKYNIDVLSSGLKILYLTDEYGIKSNYRFHSESQ